MQQKAQEFHPHMLATLASDAMSIAQSRQAQNQVLLKPQSLWLEFLGPGWFYQFPWHFYKLHMLDYKDNYPISTC